MRFNLVVQFSLKIFAKNFWVGLFQMTGGCLVYDAFGALCTLYETLLGFTLVLARMGFRFTAQEVSVCARLCVVHKDQKVMPTNYAESRAALKYLYKSRGY